MKLPSDHSALVARTLVFTLAAAIAAPALSPTEVVHGDVSVFDATSPRGPNAPHHDAHPLHAPGSRAVASTSGDVIDLGSASSSGTSITFYVALPVTEVGTYVSDQIVADLKFSPRLEQAWVPPTVRPRTKYRSEAARRAVVRWAKKRGV